MAEVAICSLVRDGAAYIPSFRSQLESLRLEPGDSWRLYVLEGDSRDESHAMLTAWASADPRVTVTREHVGHSAEAESMAERWARAGNACFALVPTAGTHTHVLWLEADLAFPNDLLARLLRHRVDVVAPVIFLGGLFYDTWGFRDLAGRRWRNEAPYHPHYRAMTLIEMGSVGSCVLFVRGVLDAGIRFRGRYQDGLLVGMCADARARGFKVFADTSTAILHPVGLWERQMWSPDEVELVDRDGRASKLRPDEFGANGIERHLPVLDPEKLVAAHAKFLRRAFRALRTNRVVVDVIAAAAPRRRYRMRVAHAAPAGLAGLAPLRWLLSRRTIARRTRARVTAPGGAPRASPFACEVKITFEESA